MLTLQTPLLSRLWPAAAVLVPFTLYGGYIAWLVVPSVVRAVVPAVIEAVVAR